MGEPLRYYFPCKILIYENPAKQKCRFGAWEAITSFPPDFPRSQPNITLEFLGEFSRFLGSMAPIPEAHLVASAIEHGLMVLFNRRGFCAIS
jgi:hypothetical protein